MAITVHEFAHAKVGDLSGDPTPRIQKRVTLNPLKHLDPLGTILMVVTIIAGFGIGWGKPVMLNPSKMRNPKWDHFWAVAAGPISNLLLAAVFAIILRVIPMLGAFPNAEILYFFLIQGVTINLALCFFNLLPIGPLDGHWLVGAFLKDKTRLKWYRWNAISGSFMLLMLIFLGQINPNMNIISAILYPCVSKTANFFGIHLV